ncbi:MAG: DUF2207 domain-containing protein [Chloroflexi bacterium]|nr:DUF2207 domain-containing protein [Chloroflexota bacterium]
MAVLVAVGLLFAVDPGGAIAESGFPDFQQMDLAQLAVWGFRTIGVAVAQLLIIGLWLWPKYQPPQASRWYSGTPRPGSMPAAAVSVLQGHTTWTPTLLASIIEMCQRGTLRIEPVETRVGFLYRLTRRGLAQYAWERTLCDSLPSRPTTIDALHDAIKKREDAVGDQIGEFLQQRGLFHDNPVRIRRENSDDGGTWWMAACILTGVGGGLWAALWLDQWWANVLIGLFAGLAYSFVTAQMTLPRTGMLTPTPAGAAEIGQWLGWQETLARPELAGVGDSPDSMLAYAVGLNAAQRWLGVAAKAPPWFGAGSASPLRGADLDAAYHAFMHASEWWLAGRSDEAAKAAAGVGYELELELLELESPDSETPADLRTADDVQLELPDTATTARPGTADELQDRAREPEARRSLRVGTPAPPSGEDQQHPRDGSIEESKRGGCLRGCLMWAISLLATGVVVLAVLFSLDVLSPRVKPCPLNSPPIPTPAQIAVAGDLFRDGCVSVRGTVVSKGIDELVMEIDRDEYVQRVNVRDPWEALSGIPEGRVVALAGWLRVEEDGAYAVHFVAARGSDREWWRNLLENIEGLFEEISD